MTSKLGETMKKQWKVCEIDKIEAVKYVDNANLVQIRCVKLVLSALPQKDIDGWSVASSIAFFMCV